MPAPRVRSHCGRGFAASEPVEDGPAGDPALHVGGFDAGDDALLCQDGLGGSQPGGEPPGPYGVYVDSSGAIRGFCVGSSAVEAGAGGGGDGGCAAGAAGAGRRGTGIRSTPGAGCWPGARKCCRWRWGWDSAHLGGRRGLLTVDDGCRHSRPAGPRGAWVVAPAQRASTSVRTHARIIRVTQSCPTSRPV